MSLLVARLALLELFLETRALVNRVVEFRETVGEFSAVNKKFKAVSDSRVVEILLGERRNFRGVVSDKNRLNQIILNLSLEDRV